ncbi:MAG: S46 family peptidase [Planctomycetota bacterium]
MCFHTSFLRCAVAAIGLVAAASFAHADEGMWLFNHPPSKALKEKYGFEPTAAWLEHVQKSSVRFGDGGSGSIVSASGLLMTNHHVGADTLAKFSTADRDLLKTGFYAATNGHELPCQDIELNVLWSIEDVTDAVNANVRPELAPADANAARRQAIAQLEGDCEKKSGLDCQVVTLYQGGRYHLYQYKRYTDVRLVMAPEQQIAFFGGDNDNFEYPRFDLDMCFFRIYENGEPLKPEHYLKWSKNGASDNELTFVSGHPARTQRMYTVEHLKYMRDVEVPTILRRLFRSEVLLNGFASRSAENERIAHETLFGVQNSRKAFLGIQAGLLDPAVLKAKQAAESKLRAAVEANPDFKKKWGDAWDKIAAAEKLNRALHERYSALEGRRSVIKGQLYSIARHIVRLAEEKPKPSGERLREYRDSELESVLLELYSPAPIYDDFEMARMVAGLTYFAETFGADDPVTAIALGGMSPIARAESLIKGTKLHDVATRKKLVEGGKTALQALSDPLLRFAAAIDKEARALRKQYEDEIEAVERENYAKIAAARFAIFGETDYPDATFTLRLSYGPVRGYQEGGKQVAPFTTFAGLYERAAERQGHKDFELPQRWIERKGPINRETPFNFVNTCDIIGGNSGSPVINTAGEVVGLVFDGNIQGLVWDIAYTDEQARCVAVDSRAIIEALRHVYDAGKLADELTGK